MCFWTIHAQVKGEGRGHSRKRKVWVGGGDRGVFQGYICVVFPFILFSARCLGQVHLLPLPATSDKTQIFLALIFFFFRFLDPLYSTELPYKILMVKLPKTTLVIALPSTVLPLGGSGQRPMGHTYLHVNQQSWGWRRSAHLRSQGHKGYISMGTVD